MASFKAVAGKPRQTGERKVYVRLTHNRQTRMIPTTLIAVEKDMRAGELRGGALLDSVNAVIAEFRKRANDYGAGLEMMDIDTLVRLVRQKDSFDRNFFHFADEHLRRLRDGGQTGTESSHAMSMRALADYLGRRYLDYAEITTAMLRSYKEWLRKERGTSTATVYFSVFSTIFREARRALNDEDLHIVRIPGDPFRNVKPDKLPPSRHRALPLTDIVRIQELPDEPWENSCRNFARDVFLLSFYLIGMNAVDMWEAPPVVCGRLEYNRRKTRTRRSDKAAASVLVPPEAVPLMARYADPKGEFAFGFCRRFTAPAGLRDALRRGMNAIGEALGMEGLTYYAARHSWATAAVNDCGVSIYTVEKALIHKSAGLAVTEIYVRPDWKAVDIANRKVLDALEEAGL